jgi:hypothetical protein
MFSEQRLGFFGNAYTELDLKAFSFNFSLVLNLIRLFRCTGFKLYFRLIFERFDFVVLLFDWRVELRDFEIFFFVLLDYFLLGLLDFLLLLFM